MNNLIIAALTFFLLPALEQTASAKNSKNCKEAKTEMVVEKINFTNEILNMPFSEETSNEVNVDYIINEDGKGFITYINSDSEEAKQEVVRFIENTTYNYNIVPGKVYSMKLTLNK